MPQGLQIGTLALQTGLTVDAIRFYEKSGLLKRPARTEGGFRLFRQEDALDLRFIQEAQELGFSLQEIRELLILRREGVEPLLAVLMKSDRQSTGGAVIIDALHQ